ncbi:MAG: tetratricopeptide repeat protein [Candidatus Sericytochromatia bacterium]|nr:tetratricopeptide repeat protein [Candidatus Sericytochromatia bacterium]
MSEPSPDPAVFAEILAQARTLLKARQWQAALPLLLQAHAAAPASVTRAEVAALLGRASARLHDWPRARHWLDLALAAEDKAEDYPWRAPLLHQLGRACQELADWEAARQAYLQALEHKRLAGLDAALGQTYHQLGRVYDAQGKLTEAARSYAQAVDWMQRHADSHLGLSLFQLAKAQEALAEPLQALENYTRALAVLSAQPQLRADACYRIGALFAGFQRHDEARLAFEQALEAYTQLNLDFWVGMTRLKLGLLALDQGQVPLVMQHARGAVDALEATHDVQALKMAYDLLAELSQLLGQSADARHWLARGAALEGP